MNLPLVPCETCGTNTPNTGSKRCDSCWEVEKRLQHYVRSENGQKCVLEALWGSQALADHDRRLREHLATGLVNRARCIVEATKPLGRDFADLANLRQHYWQEAAEAIVDNKNSLVPDTCPHDNELKTGEDAPCGCRS